MRRKLLDVVLGFVSVCAGIGSPIAIVLLLLAPRFGWWAWTLENHLWLVVVLILIFLSRFVVGGVLYRQAQKYRRFLVSPDGKRHRAQQEQINVDAIIAEANSKPKLKFDQCGFDDIHPRVVMTEARRLATNIAKDELMRRGVRLPWEVDLNDIARIANVLLDSDLNIFVTAKANIERRGVNRLAKRSLGQPATNMNSRGGNPHLELRATSCRAWEDDSE